jgi:hypothetical protein
LSENVKKRACGGPRHECEDNIKLNLKEAEYQDVNWIHLAHEKDQ